MWRRPHRGPGGSGNRGSFAPGWRHLCRSSPAGTKTQGNELETGGKQRDEMTDRMWVRDDGTGVGDEEKESTSVKLFSLSPCMFQDTLINLQCCLTGFIILIC